MKIWGKNLIEDNTLGQAKTIANMKNLDIQVALMPDAHFGKGATVGSVIVTTNAIIPASVGVDIGCGMQAVKTSLTASDLPENLKDIRMLIEKNTLTKEVKPERLTCFFNPSFEKKFYHFRYNFMYDDILPWPYHDHFEKIGTLGGGNHFIEICLDEDKAVWVMLHSGSRSYGAAIGSHYIIKAKEDMKRWYINLPDNDLAYIPDGADYFSDYVKSVQVAQEFAKFNRMTMMEIVLHILKEETKQFELLDEVVDCHHNYVRKENHFGKNVWVTRKGAINARKGTLGIIPGSMGDKSYIVEGLGNPDSFHSASHGAGRKMSRTQAKKQITEKEHQEALKGVEYATERNLIDESPGAYKDIDDVMNAQKDLVSIKHTLKQVLVVKES